MEEETGHILINLYEGKKTTVHLDVDLPRCSFTMDKVLPKHNSVLFFPYFTSDGELILVSHLYRKDIKIRDFPWADSNTTWESLVLIVTSKGFLIKYLNRETTLRIKFTFPSITAWYYSLLKKEEKLKQLLTKYVEDILVERSFYYKSEESIVVIDFDTFDSLSTTS